jgi:hypothetical protein
MNDASPAGTATVRADLVGTGVFVVIAALALIWRDERPAQVAMAVVSMVLFAIGAFTGLAAYVRALERSRIDEIGVANLFLLTGTTAPGSVKTTMSAALAVQVVVGLAGAIVGAVGLSGNEVNTLAFGILVPMFGIGLNGLWAVRCGRFSPRLDKPVQPSRRRID